MRRTGWILSAALATMLSGLAPAALADSECRQQAAADFRSCKAECKSDYREDKFTCRGIDPACGLACLTGRMVCRDAIDAALATGQVPGGGTLTDCATGTDGCKAALQTAKDGCGAPCNGNQACDLCVDAAQVDSFICRDTCRESWRANATLDALRLSCRETFRACVDACPPAP